MQALPSLLFTKTITALFRQRNTRPLTSPHEPSSLNPTAHIFIDARRARGLSLFRERLRALIFRRRNEKPASFSFRTLPRITSVVKVPDTSCAPLRLSPDFSPKGLRSLKLCQSR